VQTRQQLPRINYRESYRDLSTIVDGNRSVSPAAKDSTYEPPLQNTAIKKARPASTRRAMESESPLIKHPR
jgi:hypothetical protein